MSKQQNSTASLKRKQERSSVRKTKAKKTKTTSLSSSPPPTDVTTLTIHLDHDFGKAVLQYTGERSSLIKMAKTLDGLCNLQRGRLLRIMENIYSPVKGPNPWDSDSDSDVDPASSSSSDEESSCDVCPGRPVHRTGLSNTLSRGLAALRKHGLHNLPVTMSVVATEDDDGWESPSSDSDIETDSLSLSGPVLSAHWMASH